MEFLQVFELIAGEREYQKMRWPGHKHSVGAYLSYLSHYLAEAIRIDTTTDYNSPEHLPSREALRKFATLCFAALEPTHSAFPNHARNHIQKRLDEVLLRESKNFEFSEILTKLRCHLDRADALWALKTSFDADHFGIDGITTLAAWAVRGLMLHDTPARVQTTAMDTPQKVDEAVTEVIAAKTRAPRKSRASKATDLTDPAPAEPTTDLVDPAPVNPDETAADPVIEAVPE